DDRTGRVDADVDAQPLAGVDTSRELVERDDLLDRAADDPPDRLRHRGVPERAQLGRGRVAVEQIGLWGHAEVALDQPGQLLERRAHVAAGLAGKAVDREEEVPGGR